MAVHDTQAYDDLGALYDVWCAEVHEDIDFYVGLARALAYDLERPGIDIIELGAGSGRISVELANAGHSVRAIDLSRSQLERLSMRIAAHNGELPLTAIHGDMRELGSLVEAASADLILVPFRGLLHATTDRGIILDAARAVLRPNAVFAFDVFHPDSKQIAATNNRWLKRRLAPTTTGAWRFDERARYHQTDEAGGAAWRLDVDVRCRWQPARRRHVIHARPTPELADPLASEPHERFTQLSLDLIPAQAWHTSLLDAGFSIDGAYGWFDARPLDSASDDSIWVARRAVQSR
jgi:ubiquinone/menaquinone biosynthesis C-methylase UbiE